MASYFHSILNFDKFCAMISIINYGMGNIKSVQNALSFLGEEHKVISTATEIQNSQKMILPGVGSFKQAMQNINKLKIFDSIRNAVLGRQIPILGICLGMQLFANYGEEDGYSEGLGLIEGSVQKFKFIDKTLKIPHIGFSSVVIKENSNLFIKLGKNADFYFVHSFKFIAGNENDVTSYTDYGGKFVASLQKGNIFATQFHPEKSQSNGLTVLKNFINCKNYA